MTAEQILMRQEIRQMLNEAGINKNTLKDMVKEVLEEEFQKAFKQTWNETNLPELVRKTTVTNTDSCIKSIIRDEVRGRVAGVFDRMRITIDITDKNGTSSLDK